MKDLSFDARDSNFATKRVVALCTVAGNGVLFTVVSYTSAKKNPDRPTQCACLTDVIHDDSGLTGADQSVSD